MFPLKERKIGGFKFSEKTWYTTHHLGVDYKAKSGTKLYAPFNGKIIKQFVGDQGGLTIWFAPEKSTDIIRFMHLSKFMSKIGKVKEGDVIALTGNTGSATTGAHLHLDISKKEVILSNFKNFIDPEKFEWEKKTVKKEIPAIEPTPIPAQPEPITEPYKPNPLLATFGLIGKVIDLIKKK